VVCDYKLVLQVKIFCLVIGVMEEQRVAIKFCVKAGKSAVETIELINKAYGSAAMSHANVYRWYARFRDGREDVKDYARIGRPSTARTDENMESVCHLLTEDHCTTLQVIADRLNIAKETIRRIETEDLGKKKDLREICSSRLDHRAETRMRCLLPGSSFNGTR
jgi:transposase